MPLHLRKKAKLMALRMKHTAHRTIQKRLLRMRDSKVLIPQKRFPVREPPQKTASLMGFSW